MAITLPRSVKAKPKQSAFTHKCSSCGSHSSIPKKAGVPGGKCGSDMGGPKSKCGGTMQPVKSGEGSRGGKIIGHTKSGKPVYGPSSGNINACSRMESNRTTKTEDRAYAHADEHVDHAHLNLKYSQQDHKDAAALHIKEADSKEVPNAKTYAHNYAHLHIADSHRTAARAPKAYDKEANKRRSTKKSEEGDSDIAKSGEGSRGGKIIGHTKSGKPVYGPSAGHTKACAKLSSKHHQFETEDKIYAHTDKHVDHAHNDLNYDKQDHKDAASLHRKEAEGASLANNYAHGHIADTHDAAARAPKAYTAEATRRKKSTKKSEEGDSDMIKSDIGISDIFKGSGFAVDDNGDGSPNVGGAKDAKGKKKPNRPGEGVRAEAENAEDITDGGKQPGGMGAGDIEGSHHKGAKKGADGEDVDLEKGTCKSCNKSTSLCKCGSTMKSASPWTFTDEMHGMSDAEMARQMESGNLGAVQMAPLDKRPQ